MGIIGKIERRVTNMNNKVIATIDVSRPAGRKIVRDLQKKRTVTLEYPAPEGGNEKTYTHQEVWEMVEKRMSEHYGREIKIR